MFKIKQPLAKIAFQLTFLFAVAQFLVWLYYWQKLPPAVPLFYSLPWGERQLTSPTSLVILPVSSLAIALTNLTISAILTKKYPLLVQLPAIFATICSFLAAVTLLKIIFLIS